ncbi:MAG: ribbon-helix-helix protein, CopG family [Gemmatimonadota bacterium]|nr:ribbon-helix-helix protein, CopG family [Gemmatimonadota bacterium]
MRTIIDLPAPLLNELDSHARRQELSRAEAVRRAIAEYLSRRPAPESDAAFGIWQKKKIDALTYVDRMRDEW